MKLFPTVSTLLLASLFLIVGCSEPSGKKVTFPIPASEDVEVDNFGLELAARQKLFFLLMDAEQRSSKEALLLFPNIDKSNNNTEFREKLEELKAALYLEVLKSNKLTPEIGEAIIIEGIKFDWADISNSKKINKERREVPAKKKGSKTGPKKRPVKVKTDK